MKMTDPAHPVWPLLRFAIVGAVLTIVLYANASHFDETEAKAITVFLGLYGGSEAALRFAQNTKREE